LKPPFTRFDKHYIIKRFGKYFNTHCLTPLLAQQRQQLLYHHCWDRIINIVVLELSPSVPLIQITCVSAKHRAKFGVSRLGSGFYLSSRVWRNPPHFSSLFQEEIPLTGANGFRRWFLPGHFGLETLTVFLLGAYIPDACLPPPPLTLICTFIWNKCFQEHF
jgi:hypothetical protein